MTLAAVYLLGASIDGRDCVTIVPSAAAMHQIRVPLSLVARLLSIQSNPGL
jgi:hypothetical protein